MNTPDQEGFEQRVKATFDASVDALDGRTRSALTQARHAALEEAAKSHRVGRWRVWGPLSGVAAAALVLVVMFGPALVPREHGDTGSPFEDLDIIADAEGPEMLENIEFYAWLDSVDALPSDG